MAQAVLGRSRGPVFAAARLTRLTGRLGEGQAIFALGLALNLAMAWVVVFRLNIFVTDSMARTVHAWQVFFSADPKLAYIGFIWAPLPTLLQLPLVLLPPLRVYGISGNVLTAVMGAATLVSLNRILRRYGVGGRMREALLLLFALNPMVLFYAGNGLSEMTFVFFTILSVDYLIAWRAERTTGSLVLMGVALALALLARYDTAVHAAVLLPVLLLLVRERPSRPQEAEAVAMTALLPVAFAGGLWLLFNLMIMGDALNFARGAYSNAAQIGYQMTMLPVIAQLTGNPPAIVRFIAEQVTGLFPFFSIGLFLLLLDFARTRDRLSLSIALLALSFPGFQALNFFGGQSAAFLRYFILAIPFGIVIAGHLLWRMRGQPGYRAGAAAILVTLAMSDVASGLAMGRANEWGQWNDIFVRAVVTGQRVDTWAEERQLADYLVAHVRGPGVLVDDFQGYRVIFFSERPDLFVATGDSDFDTVLRNPVGRVQYVLASSPRLEGALNRVNQQYPTLYEYGASWARLVGTWPEVGWKLYEVVPQ